MIQNTIISRFKWKEDNNNVLLGWYIERPSSTETAYLYKQFLWKLALHWGVVGVTDSAYMCYSESTDIAFILLSSFCGNCATRVVKQVPQMPLITMWLPDGISFQFYQIYKQFLFNLLVISGRSVSTGTGNKLQFIKKPLLLITLILLSNISSICEFRYFQK